jgi:hypothetical protein
MFNCVVSQSLSAINSAAVSIKIISTDLWVFLTGVLSLILDRLEGLEREKKKPSLAIDSLMILCRDESLQRWDAANETYMVYYLHQVNCRQERSDKSVIVSTVCFGGND